MFPPPISLPPPPPLSVYLMSFHSLFSLFLILSPEPSGNEQCHIQNNGSRYHKTKCQMGVPDTLTCWSSLKLSCLHTAVVWLAYKRFICYIRNTVPGQCMQQHKQEPLSQAQEDVALVNFSKQQSVVELYCGTQTLLRCTEMHLIISLPSILFPSSHSPSKSANCCLFNGPSFVLLSRS